MGSPTRLVTIADVDVQGNDDIRGVSARHELELSDGTRVLLLGDRGWGGGSWARASISDVQKTARDVVGPDEPFSGRSQEDMAALHWNELAETAMRHGVVTDASELRHLPHDVIITARLRARISLA